ncbi:nickel transporter [Mixta theicola]|uniref:Nickel/cobalt efflux system n=1 Tax=Mixta theicola TaxID=1458355 RepID=A0A2K1QDK0_9GAMM|nr:nickel transporter [Mixta theicola]PNS13103.1 nickel transporter [Mixta theicola]GLR09372.1 nickel/cobalt efflux system [Mixta theicola]
MLRRTLCLPGRQSLGVIATLLALLALFCWWNWNDFLAWSLATQITLHRYLVLHLLQINNGQYSGGLWLLFFTFLYGVLHAVGPGHGKFVVTTWLSTQQHSSPALRAVPLIGSLVQGLSAILFVFILAVGFNLMAGDLSLSRWVMEKISALLIAAFGGWMLLRGLRSFPHTFAKRKAVTSQHTSADAVHYAPLMAHTPVDAVSPHSTSHHDTHQPCGCGHHHIPLVQPASRKELLGVIIAIGLRPCSGAITVLLFSNAIGIVKWGMLAVMTMALGTGLSLLLLAIAVSRLRDTVAAIWLRESPAATTTIIALVRIAGGVLLLFFALILFLTVVPVSPNGDFIAAGC